MAVSDIIAEKMETAAIRNLTFPIKVKARKRGRGLNRVVEGRKEFELTSGSFQLCGIREFLLFSVP